eukprot:scaffold101330_cov67-Phaeocystis_antarctica.AAC.2
MHTCCLREKGLSVKRTYLGRKGKPRIDGGSTSGPTCWLRSSLVSAPVRTSPGHGLRHYTDIQT